MTTKLAAALLAVLALAVTGCAEVRGPEGLTPKESACIKGKSGELEPVKECEDLKPEERAATLRVAHNEQVESEEHEAEAVIKKRHAEELANSAEGR
jgi:hypothetical protein